ncbi:hypothetical protein H5410_051183, partial [Solanum commersonii]
GCYNIWNNKYTLDEIFAHLSDKASQSVFEKAKLLQHHLHFQMVSKDDLWPKYFNTPEAIVDDIELFFFPSKARATQGSSSCLLASKICLNCGDKGFPNALIHCVNCLEFVVHR